MANRTRRSFLQKAAAGVAGAAAMVPSASRATPSSAASQDRVAGANRRVRVGLIGCGGMGTNDLGKTLRLGAQCVALCDVDDEQREGARPGEQGVHADGRFRHA